MRKLLLCYAKVPIQIRKSICIAGGIIGLLATILSVIGISLNDLTNNYKKSIFFLILIFWGISIFTYSVLGKLFNDSIKLDIRNMHICISNGDIFEKDGWKVIGCDSHFDTRVDDVVISKKSLHGQFVLEHGDIDEIRALVEEKARTEGLEKNADGLYDFPLGTIIRYDNSRDNKTYLLLSMTRLDKNYKAHTNMQEYEQMLMKMWNNLENTYAGNDVVLPLFGTGIVHFDDGFKEKKEILRCMLCTLNHSGVSLNSNLQIIIHNDSKDIPLYEFRNLFF